MVVDDKPEPAGLKFSKCSDHAEFTRDSFFLLQNIRGGSEVSRVIFVSSSSNPKTDGKGITTFFRRTADFSVWCSITNAPGCCGLLVFTFRVNISWDIRGSDLLTFRPSGIDVTLFK